MPDEPSDKVASVLDPALRRPFMLLVAVAATITTVLFALARAEEFVDGRVELKLQTQRERAEEQASKLQRMEDQFALMRDTLAEIRADVRVLRSRVEQDAPAARESIRK